MEAKRSSKYLLRHKCNKIPTVQPESKPRYSLNLLILLYTKKKVIPTKASVRKVPIAIPISYTGWEITGGSARPNTTTGLSRPIPWAAHRDYHGGLGMLLHEMQPPGAQGGTQTVASLRREQKSGWADKGSNVSV